MSGHGHVDASNKKIALVIAVLALFLAISETLSKAYQTEVITKQVEASNLWAFFQAKSIRKTTTDVALQSAQISPNAEDPKVTEQIKKWAAASKRYDTEPDTGEGRKELAERAKKAQALGELANHKYHNLEISSGVLQVAIVLASSAIITNVMMLAWLAGGLGIVAVGFGIFAMFGAAALF
jgi:flagellar motility protein MotE (MotC chaperone)